MRPALAIAAVLAVALTTAPVAAADKSGPDWVSSDNVEYLGSIKQDVGLTTGAKRLAFSGRIGKRALKRGRYRMAITATDAAGNRSKTRVLKFTIVRR